MVKFAEGAGFESIVNREIADVFELGEDMVGKKVNLFEKMARSKRMTEALQEYVKGRPGQIDDYIRVATSSAGALSGEQALKAFRNTRDFTIPYMHIGEDTGSTVSRVLGAVNEAIRTTGERTKSALSHAGPVALAGLAVAGAVGLMSTSTKSKTQELAIPPQHEANGVRPDSVGTTDAVPDEPIAGSQSSVNPKRMAINIPNRSTKTAIVGPTNRSMTINVRGNSADRNSAITMSKLIDQFAGASGHSNITVNNHNSWGGSSKLRQRQRVRDQINRY
jgi:hypothetical protein